MLEAAVTAAGCEARGFGIVPDEESALISSLKETEACDLILISGGSSAGTKDITLNVINSLGKTLIHGIAIKPGKPTIIGEIGEVDEEGEISEVSGKSGGKPVFGLPGHPVAVWFVFEIFVYPLLCSWLGATPEYRTIQAKLSAAIPSNHGREEYLAVRLEQTKDGILVIPVRGKSGLITLMSDSDGYIVVPRDCEGLKEGSPVNVNLYR
jgi:molybdopterin molybdotransferase